MKVSLGNGVGNDVTAFTAPNGRVWYELHALVAQEGEAVATEVKEHKDKGKWNPGLAAYYAGQLDLLAHIELSIFSLME